MRSTRSSRCSGRTAAGRNRNRSADAGRSRDRRPAPFSKGRYGPSRTKHMQPTSPCRNEDDIAADIPRQHGILPLPLRRNVRDRPLRALRETELPQPLRHPDGRGPRVAHRPRRQGRQHPQAARVRHAHRLLQTLAAPALDVHSLRLQEFPLLRPFTATVSNPFSSTGSSLSWPTGTSPCWRPSPEYSVLRRRSASATPTSRPTRTTATCAPPSNRSGPTGAPRQAAYTNRSSPTASPSFRTSPSSTCSSAKALRRKRSSRSPERRLSPPKKSGTRLRMPDRCFRLFAYLPMGGAIYQLTYVTPPADAMGKEPITDFPSGVT